MAEKHELTIKNDKVASCTCGQVFPGTPSKAVKSWEEHLEIRDLLRESRTLALAEREARRMGEINIRRLLSLGVSTRDISAEIGNDENGNLMVSPTLVQRLGKDAHENTPRRRRRS
jgi:hypothetical protein